jgi:UPF0755 protein
MVPVSTPGRFLRRSANAFVLLALLCGMAVLYAIYWPNTFHDGAEKNVFVSRGLSFHAITDSLEKEGIIRSRLLFQLTARLYGGTERLRVGKYAFRSGMSNAEIFLSMREGRNNLLISVTIPEGLRSRAQARIFSRLLGIDSAKYMATVNDPAVVAKYGLGGTNLEGFLLPDTYRLTWETEEREIVDIQIQAFKRFFADSLVARAADFGWSVRQVVTFASIVEGEAVLDEERPLIAGVYHNRLRIGMRLEADPTLQFIFGNGPRRVLYSDLRIANPYNTYLYPGLPPGPVNSPGRASILASLYPQRHDYLYFVANTHGGHWFARTLNEHVENVRKYRRARSGR